MSLSLGSPESLARGYILFAERIVYIVSSSMFNSVASRAFSKRMAVRPTVWIYLSSLVAMAVGVSSIY